MELIEIEEPVPVTESESGPLGLVHSRRSRLADPPADQAGEDCPVGVATHRLNRLPDRRATGRISGNLSVWQAERHRDSFGQSRTVVGSGFAVVERRRCRGMWTNQFV